MIVDPSQHIGEIGLGIEPCEFRGLDDRHGVGDGFAAGAGCGQRAAIMYSIIVRALCRARHKAVYAARRTMPSGAVIHNVINDLRALGSA